jgi:hypothetical protein
LKVLETNEQTFDWRSCVDAFTDKHVEQIAKWRGYSVEFVKQLRDKGQIGIHDGLFAFPVHNDGKIVGAHVRNRDGKWFYFPEGVVKVAPFVPGKLIPGKPVNVFESTWDGLDYMDKTGERDGIIITRGAGNGKLVAGLIPPKSPVYAWKQNDELDKKTGKRPADEWLKDVMAHAKAKVLWVKTPAEFKDLNAWTLLRTKAGTTREELREELCAAVKNAEVICEAPTSYPSRNAEAARDFQEAIKNADAAHEENRDELTSLTSLGAADAPAPLEQAAFHGLAGDFVKRVLPHTEADPVALLIQFLLTFGNVTGRTAHAIADGASHYCNENVVVVGETSKARKGTGLKHVKKPFKYVDPTWSKNCVTTGLSSGEGLIWAVRDPIEKMDKGETVVTDPGVEDKRLLVVEEEFSKVLVVADREGSTLSAILRSAWDGDEVLRTMTKNSPVRATDAHISTLGHITREELRRKLTETAAANGLGNRFLFPAVRRSKVLPEGGGSYGIADLVERLQKAVSFAREVGELKRDEAARRLWAQVYPALSAGKPGLLGAITARAEAHVLRLSVLYALLDCSQVVRIEHLKAALEVWRYCEDSARWIFETKTGNKQADRVLAALKVAGGKGLTKWEITSHVFNRNATRFEIDEALRLLYTQNLAFRKEEKTKTKSAERWFYRAKPHAEYEESTPTAGKAGDTSYSSCTPAEPVSDPGTVGPAVTASGGSVRVMITKQMEADLRARGYSQSEINQLTPQKAEEILAAPTTPVAGSDQEIAADIVIGKDPEGETIL